MSDVYHGHRERLRSMFLKNGLSGLEPHNALEMVLTYSIPRRDVSGLARRLIDEFGGFDKVLEADYEQLLQVKGVGEHTAAHLKLMLESYRYYERQKYRKAFFAVSADAAIQYARSLFVGETKELCFLLCFDANMKLIRCAKVSEGGLTATAVPVRRVVEIATANKAVSAILTHNHPGGLAAPSGEDLATTKKVMSALALIGAELSDHIIVNDTQAVSLAQTGALYGIKKEADL